MLSRGLEDASWQREPGLCALRKEGRLHPDPL